MTQKIMEINDCYTIHETKVGGYVYDYPDGNYVGRCDKDTARWFNEELERNQSSFNTRIRVSVPNPR